MRILVRLSRGSTDAPSLRLRGSEYKDETKCPDISFSRLVLRITLLQVPSQVTTVVERRKNQLPSMLTTPLRNIAYIFGICRQKVGPEKVQEYLPVYLSAKCTSPPVRRPEGRKVKNFLTLAERFGPTNPCANTVDTEPFPTTVLKANKKIPLLEYLLLSSRSALENHSTQGFPQASQWTLGRPTQTGSAFSLGPARYRYPTNTGQFSRPFHSTGKLLHTS